MSGAQEHFAFVPMDLEDGAAMVELFARELPRAVVHLAAQAGMRYSIENLVAYIQRNLVGFGHVLEGRSHQEVDHLV